MLRLQVEAMQVWFAPSSDACASFQCIRSRREGVRYFVEHCDGWLYIMHNIDSPNFSVSRAKVLDDGCCGEWEDFIAAEPDGAILEDMDM
jgi:protease II